MWWYNHEKEQKLEDISREGKSSVVVGQVRLCGVLVSMLHICSAVDNDSALPPVPLGKPQGCMR